MYGGGGEGMASSCPDKSRDRAGLIDICVWVAYCTLGLPLPVHCCGLYGAAIGELATGEGVYGEMMLFANGENELKEVVLAGVCRLLWMCAKALPCVMIPGRTAEAARPAESDWPY